MNKTIIKRLETAEAQTLKKDLLVEITDSGAIHIHELSSMKPVSLMEAQRVIQRSSEAFILFLDWRGVPEGDQEDQKEWHRPEDPDYQEWYELILKIEEKGENDDQSITSVSIEET